MNQLLIAVIVALTTVVVGTRFPSAVDAADEYVASLGGVPVGGFGRSSDRFGNSEVHAASIAGAKVGISGRDGRAPAKILRLRPIVKPFRPIRPFPGPFFPIERPFFPIRRPFMPIRRPLMPIRRPFLPPYYSPYFASASAYADGLREKAKAKALTYGGGY